MHQINNKSNVSRSHFQTKFGPSPYSILLDKAN